MSYEKRTWVPGETVTAAKLNYMEEGIANAGVGSGLPEVTAEDNGKMLIVNGGDWLLADLSQGLSQETKEVFFEANADAEWDSGIFPDTYNLQTVPSVSDARLVAGDQYVVTFNGDEYSITAEDLSDIAPGAICIGEYSQDGPKFDTYPFFVTTAPDGDITTLQIYVPSQPTEFKIEHIIQASGPSLLPSVSKSDNGKALAVVGGKWETIGSDGIEDRETIYDDTISEYNDGNGVSIDVEKYASGTSPSDVNFLFTPGEKYIVTFDGVEYELTAAEKNNSYGSRIGEWVNNTGSFDNYPFYIEDDYQSYVSTLYLRIYVQDDSDTHTVKIEHVVTTASPVPTANITKDDDGAVITVKDRKWIKRNLFSSAGEDHVLLPVSPIVPSDLYDSDEGGIVFEIHALDALINKLHEGTIGFHNLTPYVIFNGTEYAVDGYFYFDDDGLLNGELSREGDADVQGVDIEFNEIPQSEQSSGNNISVMIWGSMAEITSQITLSIVLRESAVVTHTAIPFAMKAGSGFGAIREGRDTNAYGEVSHAEGLGSFAEGFASHAEGRGTHTGGETAHAEGNGTRADGDYSHAEGNQTKAYGRATHVIGEYNVILNPSSIQKGERYQYVEIVGNGTDDNTRSNARTLDWSGNEALAGGLTLGKGTADETTITAAQLKALLALLS